MNNEKISLILTKDYCGRNAGEVHSFKLEEDNRRTYVYSSFYNTKSGCKDEVFWNRYLVKELLQKRIFLPAKIEKSK
jgi:hypothetical protein